MFGGLIALVALLGGSRLRLTPASSTYFQLVDYSAISDRPDTEFALDLIRRHGVAVDVGDAQRPLDVEHVGMRVGDGHHRLAQPENLTAGRHAPVAALLPAGAHVRDTATTPGGANPANLTFAS